MVKYKSLTRTTLRDPLNSIFLAATNVQTGLSCALITCTFS